MATWFSILFSAIAICLAILLRSVVLWEEHIPFRTRFNAILLDHILPKPHFNLCSLVGLLRGCTNVQASRRLVGTLGSLAVLDTVKTVNTEIAGVPVRVYRPAFVDHDEVLPVMIYFHGGGFVTGNVDSHNIIGLRFCSHATMVVISVDYRLGPEHVYPAAFEDCLAVTRAVLGDEDVARRLYVNSSLVSIGGDSAGGGLAAAVSLYVGRTDLPRLRAQVSVYPTLRSVHADREKLAEYSAPAGLSLKQMLWFRSMYLGGVDGPQKLYSELTVIKSQNLLPTETWEAAARRVTGDTSVDLTVPPGDQYPYAASFLNDSLVPLLAKNLGQTPPTYIILAGIDPLYEDGLLYARRLKADGVQAVVKEYDKQIHAFFSAMPIDLEIWGRRIRYPGNAEAYDALKRAVEFVLEKN